jgi:hypothetical protein
VPRAGKKVTTVLTFFDADGVKSDDRAISTLIDDTFSPASVVKSDTRHTQSAAIDTILRVAGRKSAADVTFYMAGGQKSEDRPHFLRRPSSLFWTMAALFTTMAEVFS